jgi:UDP-4-amino-4,6-dideoxy-N-acetyl-beta-L-altrosamine transaminase
MMKNIPYGKQDITQDDINAVIEVLRSDYLTQGPSILEFEKEFSKYIGCKYSIVVANGTAALHLSALALNIKPGDKVITTPITFAASANCVRYCGGEVVFADIDPETYLLDIESVRKLLSQSPNEAYKGLILVDFAGRAVDLQKFKSLADEFGLWIIEDACHAPGAYFIDDKSIKQNCGNGNFADLAVFSFHPVKHIATGEGGMITTNNEALYKKLLKLRTHGITKNSIEFKNTTKFANGFEVDAFPDKKENSWPGWYMEMQDLGYNYRISDIQAALGLSQLNRLDISLAKRKLIAKKYQESFVGKPFLIGQSGVVPGHAYHLYILEIEKRLDLYNYLKENKIFAQIHYIPCHLMPYYRELGWAEGDLPFSENYYKYCISLPMYPTLTEEEQNFVINKIIEFYGR